MKIRIDFVTNSSSSSFIFTKDDMPAIRKKFKLKEKEIEEWIINYISINLENYYMFDKILYEILLNNYDRVSQCAKKYANVPAGVILENILEAKYMYFDDGETHYLIADVIKESQYCIYGCNHMG